MRLAFCCEFQADYFRIVSDNHALSLASAQAKKEEIPLIVLFVISPQDYKAHDRGPRRIDFTLRNLAMIRVSFLGVRAFTKLLIMIQLSELFGRIEHSSVH